MFIDDLFTDLCPGSNESKMIAFSLFLQSVLLEILHIASCHRLWYL